MSIRAASGLPSLELASDTHIHTITQLYLPFEKAAQLYAENEWKLSYNQQHKTLKRYLVQSAQWRHINMFSTSQNPNIFAEIYIVYC